MKNQNEIATIEVEQNLSGFHLCSQPETTTRVLDSRIDFERASMILLTANKWANGTTLHYYFFDQPANKGKSITQNERSWYGNNDEKEVVRKAFQMWKKIGIGLEFKEVQHREEAEVRIGFMKGDGSWSYLGRDILSRPTNERTMNFGWDITTEDPHNGITTALHELGHTLGCPHAHQNPFSGIKWDEEEVYKALAGHPNYWSREKTFHNILRKLDPREVEGSDWDPESVMQYPFGPGLILEPQPYKNGVNPKGGLSENDKKYMLKFYPSLKNSRPQSLQILQPSEISVSHTEQEDFVFEPVETRTYTIQTFGKIDTVLVLFLVKQDGELQYLTADDNGGVELNASVQLKLFRGEKYAIKLRVYYKHPTEKVILMIW